MLSNVLIFVHSYVASKMEEKGNDEMKEELFKSLIDTEIELKFG